MTSTDLPVYLLFVLPGFISGEIFRFRYPAKKDSDFARLGWSVIYSFLILGIAKEAAPFFNCPFALTFEGPPDLYLIGFVFALALLTGTARIGIHWTRITLATKSEKFQFLSPDSLSTWALVNNELPQQWAMVVLKNGDRYLGYISNWTFDPNTSDHDFLLSEATRVDESLNHLYKVHGRGVYLRSTTVDYVEFWVGD